ncbi:MAG: DUF2760 domain-containing protein [Myxococcales bacterium]|nr:DUF2760 domain-containing protein [Polyangiaceae bacterium]MDW8247748.1 DUF2760 domain-containing protein [Myxococcales bacterium]
MEPSLPFSARIWLAFACLFRVLFDGHFASRVYRICDALPAPPPPPDPPPLPTPSPAGAGPELGALQLLAALQREGRFLDFLGENPAGVSDADLGAAARQIHQGCQKALQALVQLAPVHNEEEGSTIQVPVGYDAGRIKLTGHLRGAGPYRGTLVHRGWEAREVSLPTLLPGADPRVLAPAEVEL